MAPYLRETHEGVEVALLIQPRASRTRIVGEHDGRLKISLAAPPVDGAANDALIDFLAERLAVGRRALRLSQGEASRRKTVVVAGAKASAVQQALEAAC